MARPYFRPYRILNVTPTNAEVRLIDKPDDQPIFVSLDRVRPCYVELPDVSWSGAKKWSKKNYCKSASSKTTLGSTSIPEDSYAGPTTRSQARLLDKD